MTTPDPRRRTRRGRIAAALLVAAGIALTGGVGVASADTAISYHAQFCSDAKEGNNLAFQVNDGKPSDWAPWDAPEDTWHGEWMSNVRFDTWVDDIRTPYGMGMWCYTVVRSDLSEGNWIRLARWNPAASTATRLTEVVKVDGVVFERPAGAQGWAAASPRCCSIAYEVLRAPTIPTLVSPGFADPTPVVVTGTVGSSLSRSFTATGTPTPTVTVVDTGKLPPGTAFAKDPVTGAPTLTGTPTTPGAFDFTLTASNGVGTPTTLDVTATVSPAPAAPVFADTAPVTLTGTVGTSLSRSFTAIGTPTPAVTVVDAAKLPPGTTFAKDPVTGVPTLSGTPTAAGSYKFRLAADNGVGAPVNLEVTVTVRSSPTGSLGSLGSIFGS
ncbi:hypothetical protein PXH69_21850 [Rhodococcus qingshengii]|uniref:Uncharacterized protein n=1 Tax=Rhodococcus qingshengii TaxID=334542 RepID=A0AAW6LP86_RHOSG|nr:hypothetical protein [Rhodococcus qingshengii]MDE8647623.1 hypothetical protein [Rhodococcus qingshengii]